LDPAAPGAVCTVAVSLETGWASMAGFDFLITYENGPLAVQSVIQGEVGRTCDWEYFTWHAGPGGPRNEYGRATDTVRIVSVASLTPTHVPACYNRAAKPVGLFSLVFRTAPGPEYGCRYSPVRFYWRSCYDNRISVPASITPLPHNEVETIAQLVLEPTGWQISRFSSPLPGWFGPPDTCLSERRSSPVPFVNLINGGVVLRGGSCAADPRGDLNLNGIPYEIEDSWMFAKYLLLGDTALARRRTASLAATDMNRDARTGTIEDLVLLMRAVLGEYVPDPGMFLNRDAPAESPFAPPPPKDSRATLRLEENELAVEAEDSLVAARFVFRGRIVPHVYNTRLDVYSTYVNGQTRVLVYGFFSGASFGSGPFLYWEGSGRLTGFSLATVSGGRVEVRIRR
ncbi:MAG TPA: hypothetical protein PKM94_14040, partial [candidate division Zixibacteria bacterium]|nr:hypothetical protein [candidate division Zixibacteria bacterium]